MTPKEILRKITDAALPLYGQREASSVAYMVLEGLWGVSRLDVALEPEKDVEWGLASDKALAEIAAGRPVQYVLGEAEFMGLKFEVDESVLVPRPETEELVEWIIKENDKPSPEILDIGTGSGAIAVALATRIGNSTVSAIDISPAALAVAGRNAVCNGARVRFEQADILAEEHGGEWGRRSYDVIVSNPPYIPDSDISGMHLNVTGYEPRQALFVPDDDPLVFYRVVAGHAGRLLKAGGALYFEIYERYGGEVAGLLRDMGYADIEVREDINGKQRMVRCRK